MGLMSKIIGSGPGQSRSPSDYVDLEDKMSGVAEASTADTEIHFAEVDGQDDVVHIKDKVYDGDIVFVDLRYASSAGLNVETVLDQLKVAVSESGGDIAKRSDNQLVITPSDVGINRNKL